MRVVLGLVTNLTCLCRRHHLLKTFWGWSDQQLSDGTLIWTAPSAQTYITTPGSALLFPNLCAPTGVLPPIKTPATDSHCGDRTALMPQRRRTRTQNRAAYIAAERRHNRQTRLTTQTTQTRPTPPNNNDPPPF